MTHPELEEEYSTLAPEAVRYNTQVIALLSTIEFLTKLREGISNVNESQCNLFESAHTQLEAIHTDLKGFDASNAELREWVTDTQAIAEPLAITTADLAANLPDRRSVDEIGFKIAVNEFYNLLAGRMLDFIGRIEANPSHKVGEAVIILKRRLLARHPGLMAISIPRAACKTQDRSCDRGVPTVLYRRLARRRGYRQPVTLVAVGSSRRQVAFPPPLPLHDRQS